VAKSLRFATQCPIGNSLSPCH